MARQRTRVRVSRSLRAVAVVVLASVSATALFEADLGRAMLLSSSQVAGVPPVLYLFLAFVLLRGAPVGRRLSWAVAACGIYAALGLVTGMTLSMVHPMSMEGALRRSLWSFAPAPMIHLIAAPFVLLAWRSRVVPVRFTLRVASEPTPLLTRVPAPPLPASTPDWDSVLQVDTPAPWMSSSTAFERPTREREAREVVAEPRARVDVSPASPPPVAMEPPPPAARPAPMVASAVPRVESVTPPRPAPLAAPPPRPAAAASLRPAVAAPPRPVVVPPTAPVEDAAPAGQEPVVRVPFERVADQLPAEIFTLPPARLAESLHEPHVLVIPQRLVLPQLGEGVVEIPWTLVDGQFPELALAMPQTDIRRRFPDLVIVLPMDVVLRQIPSDAIRVQTPAVDLSDIGAFPAPFNPGPPEPEVMSAPEPAVLPAEPEIAPAVPPAPPAPVRPPSAPARSTVAEAMTAAPPRIVKPEAAVEPLPPSPVESLADIEASIPHVLFTPMASPSPEEVEVTSDEPPTTGEVVSPAVVVAATSDRLDPAELAPVAALPVPALPAPSMPPPVAAPPPVPAPAPLAVPAAAPALTPPAVPVLAQPPAPPRLAAVASAVDEEAEALGRSLSSGLAPLGSFDWRARRVADRPLVCFVPPSLARDAIDTLAAGAVPLVQRLASRGVEQVTIRTTRLVCVLTPLGSRGCLAAATRRGGPVAMLELICARTARAAGDDGVPATPASVFPAVPTAPPNGGVDHGAVHEAARALTAFGPVASAVAQAEGAAPSVYVFAGQDQAELAAAARAVHETLVSRHDDAALGPLESIVLRRGRERTVVRPLRDHNGAPAMLAAAGDVALPGRAHRAAAQAAALLEAH